METRTSDNTSVAYSDPARHAVAVTPDDSNDLANNARALWIGGAGNVALDFVGSGTNVVIVGVPAGTLLPFEIKRVRSTGTTATNIVALR
jgi:hypothetical protein